MSRSVVRWAPAKINLTLEVLGRRADGYHDLRSVLATVDLCDRVRVAPAKTLDVRIRPDVGARPGEDLASRAARALARAADREARAHIAIRKRIPVAAGLGGGSSDAAATLRALATLWRVDVPLVPLAAEVGSDVPFFVAGVPFADVSGRGERVSPLYAPAVALWIALVLPPERLATAVVFAARRDGELGDGSLTERLARAFAARDADLIATIRACATNDLRPAAERACPMLGEIRERAAARGIALTLSGSGPALFAVADDEANAIRLARSLRALGLRARPRRIGVSVK